MSVPHKMPRQFKVSKNGSLIVKGRLKVPGDTVLDIDVKPHMLADHIKSGLLLPIAAKEVEEAPDAQAIKQASTPAIPTGMAPTIHDAPKKEEPPVEDKPGVKSNEGVTQHIDPPKAKVDEPKHTPTWNLPRPKLEPKTLPELNAMILERDPEVPPFDDKNEAIAFLSQDWNPPTEK